MDGHVVILTDIDNEGNYIFMNSWGKQWGNKGTFKEKKECFENTEVIFAVYWYLNDLKEEEINAYNELKNKAIKLLNEMQAIRCPICKRCAIIEQFEIVDNRCCKLKCPFETKCIFEVNYDNDNYEFILEQLVGYDLYSGMDVNEKFKLGFG